MLCSGGRLILGHAEEKLTGLEEVERLLRSSQKVDNKQH